MRWHAQKPDIVFCEIVSRSIKWELRLCVCVCVCLCMQVRARVHACMCVCSSVCADQDGQAMFRSHGVLTG